MPKQIRPLLAKWLARKKAEAATASAGVQLTAAPKRSAKKSNS